MKTAGPPALETVEVAFRYPQDGHGLDPVSLRVEPGETVLVAGPSGCGKSTLARCLTGLIPHLYRGHFSGEVWLAGARTDRLALWEIAERAGLVFQNPASQMLAATVEEEIIFGLENLGLKGAEVNRRLESVLDQFGLQELRGRTPQTLSGGEQQRLALAAILARRPQTLVLDEPLSMLDLKAVGEFLDHLDQLAEQEFTVILFEHRRELLRRLDALRTVELVCRLTPERVVSHLPPLPVDHAPFELRLRDLHVSRGGNPILNGLNLDLHGGQVVALVGRNGAGKTTLLRTLAGFQKYTGQVEIESAGKSASASSALPDFGIVFQNPDLQLFNPTVRDEIRYRLENVDETYYEWLIAALGLRPYVDSPPLLLSEGEKRRVALATALVRRPAHGVLLDEPSLGQDPEHKQILISLAHALAAGGLLVLVATHDLELATHADRLILLAPAGTPAGVLADGPPAQVLAAGELWVQAGLIVPSTWESGLMQRSGRSRSEALC